MYGYQGSDFGELRPPKIELQSPRIVESVIQPNRNDFQPTRQYWNEKEQNWLSLSVNLNPLGFANYELFKSANLDISESPNPQHCILCVILKLVILLLYFLTPYFKSILLYELIVVIGAVDFWIIKNISGRNSIGLRWWVEIDDFGQERWVFETRVSEKGEVGRIHNRIFWFVQFFMFFMFAGMFIINLSTFQITISICMIFPALFTGFNLWAFNMCNKVKNSRVGNQFMQMSAGRSSLKMPMKMD